MDYVCKHCAGSFSRAARQAGACPRCGTVFESAELVALCIGLAISFVALLLLPELIAALLHPWSWHSPSDSVVLLRATVAAMLLVGGLLILSAKFALWQGAALSAHRGLRLLWLVAFPGLLFAGAILLAGVAYLSFARRYAPREALQVFVSER